jgi:hypothetical protein
LKRFDIGLAVKAVLEVPEQLGYFIPKVVELLLQSLQLCE